MGEMIFERNVTLSAELLAECAQLVLSDVAVDGGVQLTYEPIDHPEADIGCLIYPGCERPLPPFALYEPYREYTWLGFRQRVYSKSDVIEALASEVQTLVQLERWMSAVDPTWPPCPAHSGRHPLKTRLDGPAPAGSKLQAFWACTAQETLSGGGLVRDSAYAVEIGQWPGYNPIT